MASGFTNKGKFKMLKHLFDRSEALPPSFNFVLVTSATTPDADSNTMSQFTEIANGNGYTTNGINRTANATNFPGVVEVDASDYAEILILDLVWTASGGNLPGSGGASRWCLMLDNNATPANREVYAWIDLGADRTVSDGQSLTLDDPKLRFT